VEAVRPRCVEFRCRTRDSARASTAIVGTTKRAVQDCRSTVGRRPTIPFFSTGRRGARRGSRLRLPITGSVRATHANDPAAIARWGIGEYHAVD
jgi:hypothetical protein